jgi:hypothetical protein
VDTFTIEQYRFQPTDRRLGRHVEHDERSLSFAFRAAPAAPLVSVRHERHIPVLDQGQLGSCTANAGIGAAATGRNFVGSVVSQLGGRDAGALESLAVDIYSEETRVDSFPGTYPPDDTGSSGLAAAKVLKSRGLISGYEHPFGLSPALAALAVGPTIIGINWYESMFEPASDGRLTISGKVAGGHEIALDELVVEQQRVWLTNSWGESWGIEGRAYLTWADYGRLLKEDGDVVLFTPITDTPPQPKPSTDPAGDALWTATRDWAGQRHTGSNARAAQAVGAWAKATGRA